MDTTLGDFRLGRVRNRYWLDPRSMGRGITPIRPRLENLIKSLEGNSGRARSFVDSNPDEFQDLALSDSEYARFIFDEGLESENSPKTEFIEEGVRDLGSMTVDGQLYDRLMFEEYGQKFSVDICNEFHTLSSVKYILTLKPMINSFDFERVSYKRIRYFRPKLQNALGVGYSNKVYDHIYSDGTIGRAIVPYTSASKNGLDEPDKGLVVIVTHNSIEIRNCEFKVEGDELMVIKRAGDYLQGQNEFPLSKVLDVFDVMKKTMKDESMYLAPNKKALKWF